MGANSDSGAEEQSRRSADLTRKQIELMNEQEKRNKRLEEEALKDKEEQDRIKAEQKKKELLAIGLANKRQIQANKSRGSMGASLLDDPNPTPQSNIYS
jgi:hypothetical protein